MNTFPYDSWAEALEAADGVSGYFTFGPGDNTASVILALLGIILSIYMVANFVMRENKHLTHAAEELADKYAYKGVDHGR